MSNVDLALFIFVITYLKLGSSVTNKNLIGCCTPPHQIPQGDMKEATIITKMHTGERTENNIFDSPVNSVELNQSVTLKQEHTLSSLSITFKHCLNILQIKVVPPNKCLCDMHACTIIIKSTRIMEKHVCKAHKYVQVLQQPFSYNYHTLYKVY